MVKGCLEVYKKTFTGETVPFSFTLRIAEGAYTFDFPEVQISGDWPDAGALTLFRNSAGYHRAPHSATTITRVPKVPATAIECCASHFNWSSGIYCDVNRHAYAS